MRATGPRKSHRTGGERRGWAGGWRQVGSKVEDLWTTETGCVPWFPRCAEPPPLFALYFDLSLSAECIYTCFFLSRLWTFCPLRSRKKRNFSHLNFRIECMWLIFVVKIANICFHCFRTFWDFEKIFSYLFGDKNFCNFFFFSPIINIKEFLKYKFSQIKIASI